MSYQRGNRGGIGAIDASEDPMWSGADDPEFTRTRTERAYAKTLVAMPGVNIERMTGHRGPMIMSGIRRGPIPMGAVSRGGGSTSRTNDHRGEPASSSTCRPDQAAVNRAKNTARLAQVAYERFMAGYLKRYPGTTMAKMLKQGVGSGLKATADSANAAYQKALKSCAGASGGPSGGSRGSAPSKSRPSKPSFGQFGRPVKSYPGEPAPGPATQDRSSGGFGSGSAGGGSGGGTISGGAPAATPSSPGFPSDDELDAIDPAPGAPDDGAAPGGGPTPAMMSTPMPGAPSAAKPPASKNTLLMIGGAALALYFLTRKKHP